MRTLFLILSLLLCHSIARSDVVQLKVGLGYSECDGKDKCDRNIEPNLETISFNMNAYTDGTPGTWGTWETKVITPQNRIIPIKISVFSSPNKSWNGRFNRYIVVYANFLNPKDQQVTGQLMLNDFTALNHTEFTGGTGHDGDAFFFPLIILEPAI